MREIRHKDHKPLERLYQDKASYEEIRQSLAESDHSL
jgi:hypothetical protein